LVSRNASALADSARRIERNSSVQSAPRATEQARRVQEIARRMAASPPERRQALQTLRKLSEYLDKQSEPQSSAQTLSKLAQRLGSSPADAKSVRKDLEEFGKSLDSRAMPETQKHVREAAKAFRDSDASKAASELKKAAASAAREGKPSEDAKGIEQLKRLVRLAMQGLQGGSQSVPGQQPKSSGGPSNITTSSGRGSPTSSGRYVPAKISGRGYTTPAQNQGIWRGKPQPAGPNAARDHAEDIHLSESGLPGRGLDKSIVSNSAPKAASTTPYYRYYPAFKKNEEQALNKEQVPSAYRQEVKDYFASLAPAQRTR
jgi:hypothetical protein